MTAAPMPQKAWIPDYVVGSLKPWARSGQGERAGAQRYTGDAVIHQVSHVQHLADMVWGRPPRARCGVRLSENRPSALFTDGAPLCPACASRTRVPAPHVDNFNHRCDTCLAVGAK